MKTYQLWIFAGLLLTGCIVDQKEKAQSVLADPVLREEIFHVIQNDSVMLRDMMVNIVSFSNHPETYPMRYRMVRIAFTSPVMDSLLVNDSGVRSQIFQWMLNESNHNSEFRQEISNGISKNKKLMELLNTGKPKK